MGIRVEDRANLGIIAKFRWVFCVEIRSEFWKVVFFYCFSRSK